MTRMDSVKGPCMNPEKVPGFSGYPVFPC